jgi:hypothetical protein
MTIPKREKVQHLGFQALNHFISNEIKLKDVKQMKMMFININLSL